jgi:hypothetical protein
MTQPTATQPIAVNILAPDPPVATPTALEADRLVRLEEGLEKLAADLRRLPKPPRETPDEVRLHAALDDVYEALGTAGEVALEFRIGGDSLEGLDRVFRRAAETPYGLSEGKKATLGSFVRGRGEEIPSKPGNCGCGGCGELRPAALERLDGAMSEREIAREGDYLTRVSGDWEC